MRNPYEVLGVKPTSDKSQIKKAYRKLAVEHHPDKGGDEDKFKEVNEAYSILSDDSKRQAYDGHNQPPPGFGFNPFDFFRQQASYNQQRKKRTASDDEVVFNLKISLAHIKQGSKQRIRFHRDIKCEPCDGAGGFNETACTQCGGRGFEQRQTPNGWVQIGCRRCRAAGKYFQDLCTTCRGAGMLKRPEEIVFEIKETK